MFVKPAPGIRVRDPLTKLHIPDAGTEVPEESYWLRRLRSGDVVLASPALPASPPVLSQEPIPDSSTEKSAKRGKES